MCRGFYALLISLSLLLPLPVLGQRQLLKDLQNHYPESSIYFLYPSTIRMFNVKKVPEFNQLVNHINMAVVVMIPKQSPAFRKDEIEKLKKKLVQRDYQTMFEFGMEGNQAGFFQREENGQPVEMIGLLGSEEQYMAVYVDGFIDKKDLMGLLKGGFDYSGFGDMLQPTKEK